MKTIGSGRIKEHRQRLKLGAAFLGLTFLPALHAQAASSPPPLPSAQSLLDAPANNKTSLSEQVEQTFAAEQNSDIDPALEEKKDIASGDIAPALPRPPAEETPSDKESTNAADLESETRQALDAADEAMSTGTNFAPIEVMEDKSNPELPLEIVIMMSLDQNPDLQMSAERENQAGYSVKEAKAGYYPKLQFDYIKERQFNEPSSGYADEEGHYNWSDERSVTLSQLIFDGFSTIEEVRRRQQLQGSAALRSKIQEQTTILDSIRFYFDIARYQRTVANAKNFVNEMQNIKDKIALMQEAGAASMVQLDFAKSRLAFASTELNTAMSSLNDSVSNLEQLTGKLLPFRTATPIDIYPDHNGIDFYMDLAYDNNADILLNKSERQALIHRLEVEKGAYYPDVNMNVEARDQKNDGGLTGPRTEGRATMQVSLLAFDGGERANIIKRIRSQIRELDINSRKIETEVEKNIKLSYNQITSIRETLKAIDEEIKSNEYLRQLNRQNLELGNINIIEMIEVEERLYSSRSRRQQVLSDLYFNTYSLLTLAGVLDRGDFMVSEAESAATVAPAAN